MKDQYILSLMLAIQSAHDLPSWQAALIVELKRTLKN
jgi:hypothetical protein